MKLKSAAMLIIATPLLFSSCNTLFPTMNDRQEVVARAAVKNQVELAGYIIEYRNKTLDERVTVMENRLQEQAAKVARSYEQQGNLTPQVKEGIEARVEEVRARFRNELRHEVENWNTMARRAIMGADYITVLVNLEEVESAYLEDREVVFSQLTQEAVNEYIKSSGLMTRKEFDQLLNEGGAE